MPQYRVAKDAEARRFQEQANEASERADNAAEDGRAYVLLTVLFAAALGLAGLAIKFRTGRARQITIGMASAVVVLGAIVAFTLPVEF